MEQYFRGEFRVISSGVTSIERVSELPSKLYSIVLCFYELLFIQKECQVWRFTCSMLGVFHKLGYCSKDSYQISWLLIGDQDAPLRPVGNVRPNKTWN